MSVIIKIKPAIRAINRTRHNEAGFTLMELLVVIAIFATLSAIAFIAIGPTVRSYRLKGAARQIYSDALKVRTRSIKEGKVTGLTFTGGTNYSIWAENDPNTVWSGLSGYGELNVCGKTSGTDPTDFVFYSNGAATGGGVRISQNDDAWKVYVPNTGSGSVKIVKSTPCP